MTDLTSDEVSSQSEHFTSRCNFKKVIEYFLFKIKILFMIS